MCIRDRGEAVKTATEAQSDNESEHSVLSLAASNVSAAYEKALMWLASFENAAGEITFALEQDFGVNHLTPQMLASLVQLWQTGRLPNADLNSQLRKYGVIDHEKTDDAIEDELEGQTAGLSLSDI